MSGPHSHGLYVHGHSLAHRMPAHLKLVALVAFVLAVVATPRQAYLAFAGYAALLVVAIAAARLRPSLVARRMVVEVPFVAFALLVPFLTPGEQVEVLGVSVSRDGLVAAVSILAKATLGVVASIVVAATTDARDLVLGLQRLRVPALLVQILTFMVRYLEVIAGERERMRIARESRGFVARDIRHLRVVAQSAGALFIRSYERGERVHLAMLSRGYTGSLPVLREQPSSGTQVAQAAALPVLAALVCVAAWTLR